MIQRSVLVESRRDSDGDGEWEVRKYASGARVRVLVAPSAAHARQRADDHAAVTSRLHQIELARESKAVAIRIATTVTQLRNAMLDYLGIEAGDGTRPASISERA